MRPFRRRGFTPFAHRTRVPVIAIVVTFAIASSASVLLSIWSTSKSRNRATVVEVAARQRTLVERYVQQVLLVRGGSDADPGLTASLLKTSVRALLDGGAVPPVPGDDDETVIAGEADARIRSQLLEQERLIADLAAAGRAYLAGEPLTTLHLTGHERLSTTDDVLRLRTIAALTSNVSLDAAREIAARTDANVTGSIELQLALGLLGMVVSVLLAGALVATTRRQTAHFRSLVTASTDLVFVLADGRCAYTSSSVEKLTGRAHAELAGRRLFECVHTDDRDALIGAQSQAARRVVFRIRSAAGEWRSLEGNVTDLRGDRHVRGVVVNARDVTERVTLEQELTRQAQRDNFGSQLVEALEMADDEPSTYDVITRAMAEISAANPMELLQSDSSRARLEPAAVHPVAGGAGCPVESPFSCVAVRRGSAVVFESSEALNACPKLRDRGDGGACSAVCVPISFMGRSLGVLHATGPDGVSADAETVTRMTTLATQAGSRIGTVRAFERTQLQAQTDALTGLINRRTLEEELRRMMRDEIPFALALVDLDRFKLVNDTHGHEAGDRSLRTFAHVVRTVLREEDHIARWGGEEFLIALPHSDADGAVEVMHRIRASLEKVLRGGHVVFTASFGVTDSTRAETLQDLIRLADRGLYAAKAGGRDRVVVGGPADDPQNPGLHEAVPRRAAGV
jgi:diguanylate cyclase (GGDEF)-like protein/PAS domain S-box-containing protein